LESETLGLLACSGDVEVKRQAAWGMSVVVQRQATWEMPNNVVAIDTRTVGVGLNSFLSSINVTSGNILAVLMGDAKVSYDLVGTGSNIIGPDPYSPNGAFGVLPLVGNTIALNAGGTQRQYSIIAAIPLPAGGLLLFGALGGLALLRRRKTA